MTADFMFYQLYDLVDEAGNPTGKYYVLPTKGKRFAELGSSVPADDYALISKTGTIAKSGTKKDGNGYKATYKKVDGVAYWFIGLE